VLTDSLPIGEDPAGGATDDDASRTYDLSAGLAGVTPHPQQGIHLTLTVHADGSQGSDTKFKVFWVEGCGSPTTTSTSTPPTTGPGTTTPETPPTTPGPPTTGPGTSVVPSGGPGQPGSPGGGGGTVTPSAAAGGNLPNTGSSDTLPLAAAGLALAGAGAAIGLAARHARGRAGA